MNEILPEFVIGLAVTFPSTLEIFKRRYMFFNIVIDRNLTHRCVFSNDISKYIIFFEIGSQLTNAH